MCNNENWWCGWGDLNPQGLLHSILSAARIPIPPQPRSEIKHIIKLFIFQEFYVIITKVKVRIGYEKCFTCFD